MSRTKFAKDDKSYDAALDRALTLLEYRARSAQEMRRALMQREFPEDVADEVVARLRELGYIDDAAYARALVSSTIRKGSGSRRARYALMQRGVPSVSSFAPERSIYIATMSKVIAPGLRAACAAVPDGPTVRRTLRKGKRHAFLRVCAP